MLRILLLWAFTSPLCLLAQNFEKAAGVRFGHTSGISYKTFVDDQQAVDLMLSGRNDGMQFTALYEFHTPMQVSFDENFHFYYGLGVHLGFEQFDDLKKVLINDAPLEFVFEDKTYFAMGFDGILGVEYRYLVVPMTIGFEIKPYFNYIGMRYTKATFWDVGFSLKYIF